MGKNGGKASFEITTDNQLRLTVTENEEVYNFTFMDCVFTNKFTHDTHMCKKAECCGAFTAKSIVQVKDNKVLFTTILVSQKTGKEVSDIVEYNILTVYNSETNHNAVRNKGASATVDCEVFHAVN